MTARTDSKEEADEIVRKARLKQKALRQPHRSAWYGLGLFGLVGWAVAVPTIAGIALGLWIDARTNSGTSWTLILLLVGAALGCLNAWYWVQREGRGE